jgi:hypothetical protein
MSDLDDRWNRLGERLVACRHFRWMPGMLRDDGWRFIGLDSTNGEEHGFSAPADEGGGTCWSWPIHLKEANCTPDTTDPATVGCIEALLIEATGGSVVMTRGNGWHSVETDFGAWESETEDYVEALIAALEAAP